MHGVIQEANNSNHYVRSFIIRLIKNRQTDNVEQKHISNTLIMKELYPREQTEKELVD